MELGKFIKWGLIGFAAWGLLYLSAAMRLMYRFRRIWVAGAFDGGIRLGVSFWVKNPTVRTFIANAANAEVYLNDTYIGRINSQINQRIYANSISSIDMYLDVLLDNVGQEIIDSFNNGTLVNFSIYVNGNIIIDGHSLKFEKQFLAEDFGIHASNW